MQLTDPVWTYLLAALAVLGIALAAGYLAARRRAERLQLHLGVAFEVTSDMMMLLRVEPGARLVVEMANPSAVAFVHAAYGRQGAPSPLGREMGEYLRVEMGVPEGEVEALLADYLGAARSGAPRHSVARHGARSREAVLTPIADRRGRVTHLLYRGTDVTERSSAEEDLRRSSERFALILNMAPLAIVITTSAEGRIRYVNPAWCRLMGYTREQALGMTSREVGVWSGQSERKARLMDALARGGPVQIEHSYLDPAGRRVELMSSALHIDYEGESCVLVIAADVTEAVESRRQAGRMSERFARVFGLSPVPLLVSTLAEGRFLEVNDAWQGQYGYSRDEMVGHTVDELGIWADPADRARLVERLRNGERVRNFLARLRRRDGQVFDSLVAAETLDWDGVPAILASTQDVSDLAQARREAQAARERFEKMLELSPAAITITRLRDGMPLYVNPAWRRLTGHVGEDVAGEDMEQLSFWAPGERAARLIEPLAARGSVQLERSFVNRDGRTVHVLFSALAAEIDGERCAIGIGQDVTELVEERRRAGRLTERLAKVFDVSPVPVVVTAVRDGRFLEVNEAWLALQGRRREEVIGRTAAELGVWTEEAGAARLREELRREGRVRNFQTRVVRAGGRLADTLIAAEPLDWDGVPALLVSSHDITELEQARSEAQAARERFEALFRLSPVPIVVGAITDGAYLAANQAWLDLHGYRREELDGQSSLSLGAWADPADRASMVASLMRGERVRALPTRFVRKDGSVIETLYSAEIVDWMGQPAIVAAPQDVTELRRAADEIRRLNASLEERVRERTAELERTLQELDAFSYSVSHDLRAPLRALASFAELLVRRPAVAADAEAAGYAERVTRAALRMGQVVDGLLRFSRLARQPLESRTVDLAAEVAALAKDLGDQLPGRRVSWSIGPLPQVQGDPTLLRLVLQNLIDNALKYTRAREQAHIEISAREWDAGVEVTVRDDGVGFDMAHSDKLFSPFQRLHHESEFEGTGVGLANARRIIERHGGRIWCDAAPGKGATFHFSLPRSAAH